MSPSPEVPKQAKIGPIKLAPGVPVREVFIFLLVSGIASALTAFINVMQPYVFNEIMHLPVEQQGKLAGQLMTVQQAVVLVCVSFTGALADRIGRKVMLVFAFTGFSLCALFYPIAGVVFVLFIIRFFFGLFSSAHTAGGPPKFYDYAANETRGKFMAMVMVFFAIIAVLVIGVVGGQAPMWLVAQGIAPADAGTWVLWGSAALGFFAAIVTAVGLMDDRPKKDPALVAGERKGVLALGIEQFTSTIGAFKEVYGHARTNRRFGILLITSFVIRTDEAVVASFFALWITIRGAQEGLSTAEALAIAGFVTAVTRITAFVAPPILGVLLDKFDRLTIYLITLFMVGVSFSCAVLVPNVTGWEIFALAAFIGMTENGQTISQQAFFGQEAPAHLRATSYGLLAFFGTGSVVVVSLLAGYMFDIAGPTAPFMLIGALHILFTFIALIYVRRGATMVRREAAEKAALAKE